MPEVEPRERWARRSSFVLAALGSAVGLGNLWRFPTIAAQNGGGAFLIPYFIALFTAGIPLLIVEFGLGHMFQRSAPMACKRANKRFEWVYAETLGKALEVRRWHHGEPEIERRGAADKCLVLGHVMERFNFFDKHIVPGHRGSRRGSI